jgi:SAM-dependent methyltransferase
MSANNLGAAPLWKDLSDLLACPSCKERLTQEENAFRCQTCGQSYPIIGNIPRFVTSEHYAGNFGFQWTKHEKTQLDGEMSKSSEEYFKARLGLDPEKLSGKLILDVGCGMGRYAEVASRYGARVIGIDLSRAVEAAYANLKDRPNVQIIQASVFDLPFAEGTFDYIYSIGVLHHTPDCHKAFSCLPRLLRPGGKVSIWVYSHYDKPFFFMSELYRHVTPKLPTKVLYALCHVSVPLHWIDQALLKVRLKPVAYALRFAVPIPSRHPDWHWRVLDTFDWYGPQYQSKHTYEEVFKWFEAEGMVNIRVLGAPVAMQGQRPLKKDSRLINEEEPTTSTRVAG